MHFMSNMRSTGLALVLFGLVPSAIAAAFQDADPREDWYEFQDDQLAAAIAPADVFVTGLDRLTPLGDGSYTLRAGHWTRHGGVPVCPETSFFGQVAPRIGARGRSGILVGADLVLFPIHAFPFDSQTIEEIALSKVYLFDWAQIAVNDPPTSPIDQEVHVPVSAAQAFFADPVNPVLAVGELNMTGTGPLNAANDFVIVRLDRPVHDSRTPLVVRRMGSLERGETMAIVGHPEALPQKFELATVTEAPSQGSSAHGTVATNGHVTQGSSGSMIVNADTHLLEGMITTGEFGYNIEGECLTFPPGSHAARAAGPNLYLARQFIPLIGLQIARQFIPPFGLQDPDVLIDHFGPPGGPFTNDMEVIYTLTCPQTSRGLWVTAFSERHDVICLRPLNETCAFLGGQVLEGPLDPGQGIQAAARLMPGAFHQNTGTHDVRLSFVEHKYGTNEIQTHRFRVGVDGFSVTPDEPFAGDGPGALPNARKTYELENRYAVNHTVRVRADDPWVLMNGDPTEHTLVLPPAGVPFGNGLASEELRLSPWPVTISWDTTGLTNGVYDSWIDFESVFHGFDASLVGSRRMRLDIGRRFFETEQVTDVVDVGMFETTTHVNSPAAIEILDLDVEFGVEYEFDPSWPGTGVQMDVILRSPEGTEAAPFDPLRFRRSESVQHSVSDDEWKVPDRGEPSLPFPGPLSIFDGEAANGTWTMEIHVTAEGPQIGVGRGRVTHFTVRVTPNDL
jgi:hypothetical protein